jgi:Family of unknown function (DUF5923)/Hsp70 protein
LFTRSLSYFACAYDVLSLSQVLLQAGYVLEPDCNTRGNQIRDSGRQFYDGKYKKHFDNLFSSVGDWFKAMGEDPTNKHFGEDWARLTKDLLFDSKGSLKFKPELWSDIRKVIVGHQRRGAFQRHSINPEKAVAYGAAVRDGILLGEVESEDLVLVDVCSLTLGIETLVVFSPNLFPATL